jgi:hypothetical protein
MREPKRPSLIRHSFLSGVILATSAALAAVSGSGQTAVKASATDGAKSTEDYGKLPLAFEANHGQADPSVKFLSRGNGYSLFLTDSEAVLALGRADCKVSTDANGSLPVGCAATQNSVRMRLEGARDSYVAKATGEAELPGKVNYFIGNDPAKWHSDLPTYAKVLMSRVYPGIDLVYYGNQRQLEHDFVVAPHADPTRIALSLEGTKQLRIDPATGDLVLSIDGEANLRLLAPVTYQTINGQRTTIPSRYKLLANSSVGFAVGQYNHDQPLVIDPVLVYSTYLGGSGSKYGYSEETAGGDNGNGIALDSAGNAYIVGVTLSTDFPVTSQAFQKQNSATLSLPGANSVFVSKLNATGTALIYSTYIGGSNDNEGYGIGIDLAGNAYITGLTYSDDFPVTCGAFQTSNHAPASRATGFVTKLNPTGSDLIYSTYLGGSGQSEFGQLTDVSQAIAVDQTGHAFVTGYTWSADFPVTEHAFQTVFTGRALTPNAFVTKFNPDGRSLAYSTYLGGNGAQGRGDYGNAIVLDLSGHAFVAGSTGSTNFPVTSGAFQRTQNGVTAFVTELNIIGTQTLFSTYLGGSGGDSATAIALDSQGFPYVAGNSGSSDFPLTTGLEGSNTGIATYYAAASFRTPLAFVTKLTKDASALVYSTYLEGQDTSVTGLAVDSAGAAYIIGNASPDFLDTFGGFQQTADALPPPLYLEDAFVVKLDPTANTLNYASFLGSGYARALALDSAGNVYATGGAETGFPTTSGAYQTVNNAASQPSTNAFITKLALASEVNQTSYPPPLYNPTPVDTSTSVSIFQYDVDNAYFCGEDLMYTVLGSFEVLGLSASSAPFTGTVTVNGPGGGDTEDVNFQYFQFSGFTLYPGVYPVTANYSGDANYNPSSTSIDFDFSCPDLGPPPFIAAASRVGKLPLELKVTPRIKSSASGRKREWNASSGTVGPKFQPPSVILTSRLSTATRAAQTQSTASCIAHLPPLTVAVESPVGRLYGAANPKLSYGIVGLRNGDTVTVTVQTTATPTSPVGAYPITVTVSGAALANYNLTIIPGTLDVRPATLHIVASSEAVVYGHTPPSLTAYKLTGFLNGDTASVVSGAPALSTTVTLTTPAGLYKIGIQTGTLTAANYVFSGVSNGEGVVDVTKAPLALKANNLTMTQGSPVPTLTYSLTGFVNGQSAAGTVTGTPVLTTTATSASTPGKYPITITQGSLAAANYFFVKTNGVLTVTP